MTELFTLFVGLNDKDTKVQKVSTLEAYKILQNVIGTDCTISEARGVYTHENGSVVTENSFRIEILFFDEADATSKVRSIVETIKTVLNQEAVAVIHTVEVDSQLW